MGKLVSMRTSTSCRARIASRWWCTLRSQVWESRAWRWAGGCGSHLDVANDSKADGAVECVAQHLVAVGEPPATVEKSIRRNVARRRRSEELFFFWVLTEGQESIL